MNGSTVTTYDAVGHVLSVTDSDQNTTKYVYDRLGRLAMETDPLGNSTTYTYDADGNLTQKTDRDRRTTRYFYDALGQQTEEDWGWLGLYGFTATHTIKTFYDAAGQVIGVNESDTANPAAGTNYQYTYDALGQVTEARMAPGGLIQPSPANNSGSLGPSSSRYDWNGDGHAEQYYAFSLGQLAAGQVILLCVSTTAFDPTLIVCKGDFSGMVVAHDNAGSGAYLEFTAPQSGVWDVLVSSQVDVTSTSSFSLEALTDPNPFVPNALVQFDYIYDEAGNLLTAKEDAAASQATGFGSVTTDAYDVLNRLKETKQTTADGVTVNKRADYTYNADSSVATVTRYSNDTSTPTTVAGSTYGYDAMGRLTSLSQRLPSARPSTTPGPTTRTAK